MLIIVVVVVMGPSEDEKAKRAVEGDGVFEVDDVGVDDACDGAAGEDAAGEAAVAGGLEEWG